MSLVLITGGMGFLGSHLLDLLRGDGKEIVIVDNLSSSVIPIPSGVTVFTVPIQDYLSWNPPIPTEIYHLASPVGPVGILPHAGRIVSQVVTDAYSLANMAMEKGSRLVYVSTSEIYGGGQQGLCRESMDRIVSATTSVRLEYAIAKLAAETALINLSRTQGLDCVIVRPFNVSGPRQSPRGGFVLPRFIQAALANEPLTVFGSGKQRRAMTHVTDIATGLRSAMRLGHTGEAYNLGNHSNRTTILDLAHLVLGMSKSSSTIEHVDPQDLFGPLYEEANDKFPDSTKAEEELEWNPSRSLEDIVAGTLEWSKGETSSLGPRENP